MANYSNPKIPEGINVSDDHPLKDFFSMLAGVSLFVVAVILMLTLAAEQLVRFIPFEVELSLAETFSDQHLASEEEPDPNHQRIEAYLQGLGEKMARAQHLPEDMSIRVHYIDSDEINAFATLGGNILIFRGLLENSPNENALAMVMAHEVAHIHNRDPIVAMGRGLTIGIAMMSLLGAGDGAMSQQLVGYVGMLSNLSFSRNHESEADHLALQSLNQHYGHVASAETIFEVFLKEQEGYEPPAILSTHPLNEDRIEKIKNFGGAKNGEVTPLPEWLPEAMGQASDAT